MADESTRAGDMLDQARTMVALNPMIGPQMEQFWKAQEGILEETEAFSRAWFERRHEAAKTALEAVRKTNGDGADPSAAMRPMVDWQQESLRRMAEDMQDWVEMCSRCIGRLTSAEVAAGEEGVEEVARRAKSASRTKHATPV